MKPSILFQASLIGKAIETRRSLNSRLANIHLERQYPIDGIIEFTYGPCEAKHPGFDVGYNIGRTTQSAHDRLVWVIPEHATPGGCISAWSESTSLLVGRSEPQSFDIAAMENQRSARLSRRGVRMDSSTGIDVLGPWFDGVEFLEVSGVTGVDVAAAKNKSIAIVGAGMSGLMTHLCLAQQGMTNVRLIEAGNRLGGRVRTAYLSGGPFDYSYQEMGPMRLPTTITVGQDTFNISDHQLVFQLADEMNTLNRHDKALTVDFIPWYETDPYLPHIGGLLDMEGLLHDVNTAIPCKNFCVEMATNMFKAHRKWLDSDWESIPREPWSEYAFMANYLNTHSRPDVTVTGSALCETVYLDNTTWTTIDGGMDRLPLAFRPLVENVTTFNRKIDRVYHSPDSKTVTLQSKSSWGHWQTPTNSTHDYAILAVPFSVMRKWKIDGLSTTMRDAITTLPYTSACKVALEFRTRFWEHTKKPIFGSCWASESKFPGVGNICYPSYNINGTGKAAILASYISDPGWGEHWASKSEHEHVGYVLNAMELDPLAAAGWADPTAEQQRLYLPEYFKTHNNIIFVGEHTSYTHAWIASALESGIRGSVQLLLELGLVDEAKAVVEKWMARWIEVSLTRPQ
ncbi:flavin-containing amine oxidoreductase [Cercophora newfieldiana]|uniref:Flavin-containing amine oxidoreductase n=1 Tax=Cercophora newfieldiana TaxID=92897 RepID=A0AA39YGW4_9PEZI|nr:flavin-containing amine oxidoreductase [Cercophora newfieldiana]